MLNIAHLASSAWLSPIGSVYDLRQGRGGGGSLGRHWFDTPV